MAHRALVYNVQVHRKRRKDDRRLLGNIDRSGTNLGDVFDSYFRSGQFSGVNDAATKSVACVSSTRDGDEVHAMFSHGESGYAADILDAHDQLRLRQQPDDKHVVRCGSMFRFEPAEEMGWWVVHSNNGRSAKSLIEKTLQAMFRQQYNDLTLKITPCVSGEVLSAAVADGRLDKITLTRIDRPSDRATAASAGKWVEQDEAAHIKLEIAGERGHRLKHSKVARYLRGDRDAFGEIVSFGDQTFDEAKVEVELRDGTKRTFNIEAPESGHAFSRDLVDLPMRDGEPRPDTLFVRLGEVLDDLT